ncbi:hypothetical protein FSP39_001924, partial [Pinctada imbricata]
AIDCWVCDSSSDPTNCGESVNEQGLQDSYSTASNCAACGKTFTSLGTIWSSVKRTCLTSASDTCVNKMGYGSCTCSTTYCNGQNRNGMSTVLVFVSLTLIFTVYAYLN